MTKFNLFIRAVLNRFKKKVEMKLEIPILTAQPPGFTGRFIDLSNQPQMTGSQAFGMGNLEQLRIQMENQRNLLQERLEQEIRDRVGNIIEITSEEHNKNTYQY